VQIQCLDEAVTRNEQFGVWGGRLLDKHVERRETPKVHLDDDGWPIGLDRSRFPATHCRAEHEFSQLNTIWRWHRTHNTLTRECVKCRNARALKVRQREQRSRLLVS
jgi:hypothetical protein